MDYSFEEIIRMKKTFELIAESSRNIYLLSDQYVYKSPVSEEGMIQNQNETNIFRQSTDDMKAILCPVIAGKDHSSIIMEKAIPLDEITEEKHLKIVEKVFGKGIFKYISIETSTIYPIIQQLVQIFDLYEHDLRKPSNWGIWNDRVVLIDYGCTNELFEEYYEGE